MPEYKLYLGLCDAAGYQLAVVAWDRAVAEKELLKLWRKSVIDGFEPTIRSFIALREFNGARVIVVTPGVAFNWDQAD